MITAGIDAGVEFTKAVVLKDGVPVGRGRAVSGGAGRGAAAREAYHEALALAGLEANQVERVIATGKGKYDVSFAHDQYTEGVALLHGARFLCPEATTVLQCGADETLAIVITPEGTIDELVLNQKCSAGLGTFLRTMARRLDMTMEEMSGVPIEGLDIAVSDGCTVFAELDALDLLNQGVPRQEVAAAVTKAAAVRAATVVQDVILADLRCVLMTGGLTQNRAFVKAMADRTGIDFRLCPDGVYAGAIGAALIAAR